MLRGNWHGEVLASGSDMWRFWDDRRAGLVDDGQWAELEEGIARSYGTCMTMGTASTMTAAVEVLGLTLPGASSIPAADSAHPRMAALSGITAVEMVRDDRRPAQILGNEAYEDAVTTVLAMGGSTNAVIHLVAMARRSGVPLSLDDFDDVARRTPVLANIKPTGAYLMEDFYYAGGLRALLAQLADDLHLDRPTVVGKSLRETIEGAETYHDDVIRPRDKPVAAEGGLAVLRGNLAPRGAVIKPVAADPALLRHTGPAVVFDGYADILARIDDPDLDIDENTVLVLRGAGPLGGPGMPEHGMLPIPDRLLKRGVRDMVRISDARMSGTSYGACVLHVAPESHVGGPLAFVRDGDLITLDVEERRLELHVPPAELARRRASWTPPAARYPRGYGALHAAHITQADDGCDFDFLTGTAPTPEPDAR
jgi:dihydroxy-acid dehydratase